MKRLFAHWSYVCLALFLLLTAAYYMGGQAVGGAKPWVWNRGDNEPAAKQNGVSFSAGVSTANIGQFSASTKSNYANDCVDFSSVVIRTMSEHPLGVICAEKIAEKLKTLPAIKRVEFALNEPLIGKTEPLPPWLVQVDIANLNEQTVPTRSLTGNIEVAFGNAAVRQPVTYSDGTYSPLVQFAYSMGHDVRFTFTGISSQSDFYDKIATELAKKAVESIEKEIAKLSDDSPTLPKLPEAFYPAYQEASDIPPIPCVVSQTPIIDGRRFMQPHYSLVRIESNFAGTDNEFLTEIQQAMNDAGWKGVVTKQEEHTSAHLRLTREAETFYLFKELPSKGFRLTPDLLDDGSIRTPAMENDTPPPGPLVFLLERTVKMDDDSVFSAIQTLLNENAPPSTLLIFSERLYDTRNAEVKHLREQMRARFLDTKASTPAEQVALVRFFNRDGDKEIAKDMLFKAWQVRQLTLNPMPDSDYTKLAEELGVVEEMKALPLPTAELCEEFGFIWLTPENCPMEVGVELDEEVKFVTINEHDRLSSVTLKFDDVEGTLHMDYRRTIFMEHGSSWSSARGRGTATMHEKHILPLGERGRFDFSVVSVKPIRVKVEFWKELE